MQRLRSMPEGYRGFGLASNDEHGHSSSTLQWLLLISILDITLQMIFLMMMISIIDNVELYLFKGILYCESLICVPWV